MTVGSDELPLPNVSQGSSVMTHVRVALSGMSHLFLPGCHNLTLKVTLLTERARSCPDADAIDTGWTCTCSFKLRVSCWRAGIISVSSPPNCHGSAQRLACRSRSGEWTDEWMNRLGKSLLHCILFHGHPSVQSSKHSFKLYDLPRASSGVRWQHYSSRSGWGTTQVRKQLRYNVVCCLVHLYPGSNARKVPGFPTRGQKDEEGACQSGKSGTGFLLRDREANRKFGQPKELNVAEAEAGTGVRGNQSNRKTCDRWWNTLFHTLHKDLGLHLSESGKPPKGFQGNKDVIIFVL